MTDPLPTDSQAECSPERTVETVMCPHGFNRLVMDAHGQHCAECEDDERSEARYQQIMREWAVGRLAP